MAFRLPLPTILESEENKSEIKTAYVSSRMERQRKSKSLMRNEMSFLESI